MFRQTAGRKSTKLSTGFQRCRTQRTLDMATGVIVAGKRLAFCEDPIL